MRGNALDGTGHTVSVAAANSARGLSGRSCQKTNRVSRIAGIRPHRDHPTHRSEWDPETLLKGPFDPKRAVCRFEEADESFASGQIEALKAQPAGVVDTQRPPSPIHRPFASPDLFQKPQRRPDAWAPC